MMLVNLPSFIQVIILSVDSISYSLIFKQELLKSFKREIFNGL